MANEHTCGVEENIVLYWSFFGVEGGIDLPKIGDLKDKSAERKKKHQNNSTRIWLRLGDDNW